MSKDTPPESTELTVVNESADKPGGAVVVSETANLTPAQLRENVNLIQAVMREVMTDGEHFGTIPGCGNRPTLLKSGAEKLALTFRLCPEYQILEKDLENEHKEFIITCILTHIPTGLILGQGVGYASTKEGKYRFRNAGLTCPECGKMDTIIKGKAEYGGGWVCFNRKGGCGAKFPDGDDKIEKQERGKVEHDNPPDYYNTVLKMAKKRAQVDATLTATAASDIFTQDIEDMPEVIPGASFHKPLEDIPPTQPAPPAQRSTRVANVEYGSGGVCPPEHRGTTTQAPPAAMTDAQRGQIDAAINALSQSPEHRAQIVDWVEGIAGAPVDRLDAEQAARVIQQLDAQLG